MNEVKRLDGKPTVHQGVVVIVDGKESVVETIWAQGKHRVFKLEDGRQVFDLDQLVARGAAQVGGDRISSIPKSDVEIPMPPVKEPKKWSV